MRAVIFGAGTHGEAYLSYFRECGINVVGFLDDNVFQLGSSVRGVPILGRFQELPQLITLYGIDAAFCPLGNNKLRCKLLLWAKELGLNIPNFIHPVANASSNAIIAQEGVYILPGTVIWPWSSLGRFVMINANSQVAHHTTLGDGVFLSSGVNCGASITVNDYAYLGMGSTIMTGVNTLGEDCLIGAGAVVIKDVPDGAVVAGVPAKVLKYKDGYNILSDSNINRGG